MHSSGAPFFHSTICFWFTVSDVCSWGSLYLRVLCMVRSQLAHTPATGIAVDGVSFMWSVLLSMFFSMSWGCTCEGVCLGHMPCKGTPGVTSSRWSFPKIYHPLEMLPLYILVTFYHHDAPCHRWGHGDRIFFSHDHWLVIIVRAWERWLWVIFLAHVGSTAVPFCLVFSSHWHYFFVAVTKYPTRNNARKEGFIVLHWGESMTAGAGEAAGPFRKVVSSYKHSRLPIDPTS